MVAIYCQLSSSAKHWLTSKNLPNRHHMAAKHALKWRKVEIDSSLQSQMEGFGGLEEITDYSISSSKSGIFTIKVGNNSVSQLQ